MVHLAHRVFKWFFFHRWVLLSEWTLFHVCLKRCILCIQMQCWWFIGWVWQRSAHDGGSVYGRKRADRFDLCFFLSTAPDVYLIQQGRLWDVGCCLSPFCQYMALKSTVPDWGRLRLIDFTDMSVIGGGGVGACRMRGRDAFWWCPGETNN